MPPAISRTNEALAAPIHGGSSSLLAAPRPNAEVNWQMVQLVPTLGSFGSIELAVRFWESKLVDPRLCKGGARVAYRCLSSKTELFKLRSITWDAWARFGDYSRFLRLRGAMEALEMASIDVVCNCELDCVPSTCPGQEPLTGQQISAAVESIRQSFETGDRQIVANKKISLSALQKMVAAKKTDSAR